MNHFTTSRFWECYYRLSPEDRQLADRCFELLKQNPRHPSICLKKAGNYYVARIGLNIRALAVEAKNGLNWFWIGNHAEYEKLI